MLFVGEREKDSREIIGPGARRGNLYGAREGLDSPQRMRKRGSSGGSLCFFLIPLLDICYFDRLQQESRRFHCWICGGF